MSVLKYWQERLIDGKPYHSDFFMKDSLSIRYHKDPNDWPFAVARSSMYKDYLVWYQNKFIPLYEQTEYYQRNPEMIPHAADEQTFYTTISPWLYVVGKDKQVRSYRVSVPEQYNDATILVKRYVYFVRLADLETHKMAFELDTGVLIGARGDIDDMTRATHLSNAITEWGDKVRKNREEMAPEMFSQGQEGPS